MSWKTKQNSWRKPILPSRIYPHQRQGECPKYEFGFLLSKVIWPWGSKIRGTWLWWHLVRPEITDGKSGVSLARYTAFQVEWRRHRARMRRPYESWAYLHYKARWTSFSAFPCVGPIYYSTHKTESLNWLCPSTHDWQAWWQVEQRHFAPQHHLNRRKWWRETLKPSLGQLSHDVLPTIQDLAKTRSYLGVD